MAPEYLYRGEISRECDIYSLGVIILEITTRKRNYSTNKDLASMNFIIDVSPKKIQTDWKFVCMGIWLIFIVSVNY